jgi:hypothetical protein
MVFFGFVFISSTTLVMLFKTEKPYDAENSTVDDETGNEDANDVIVVESQTDESILSTYKLMLKITKIPSIRQFMVIQLTYAVWTFLIRNQILIL